MRLTWQVQCAVVQFVSRLPCVKHLRGAAQASMIMLNSIPGTTRACHACRQVIHGNSIELHDAAPGRHDR